MICLDLQNLTEAALEGAFLISSPSAISALNKSAKISKQIQKYQAIAIFFLMSQYNETGNTIMEIGTRLGYSASIIAQAAYKAKVITYESVLERANRAELTLRQFSNIRVKHNFSWNVLLDYKSPKLAAIFVDGNHKYAGKDIAWFNHLQDDGMILFHDYTRKGSIYVVRAVETMSEILNRKPDIIIVDINGVGMSGFYRRINEYV